MGTNRRTFLGALVSCPVCRLFAATEWNYAERGPQKWSTLDPAFAACSNGTGQSPIDLRDGTSANMPELKLHWTPARFPIVNNGHSIQLDAGSGNFTEVGGRRFDLLQFHFHTPSEHAVSGKRTVMEVHFVHREPDQRLMVLAALLTAGGHNAVLSAIMKAAPPKPEKQGERTAAINPAELLPSDKSKAWRYEGSLTTPPCSENVDWIVFEQMVPVDVADINKFRAIFPMNARPLQPAHGRRIDRS